MDKILLLLLLQIFWLGSPLIVQANSPIAKPAPAPAPVTVAALPAKPPVSNTAAATNLAPAPPPPADAPSYTVYTYYGDRYRDPFIPLTGEFRNDQGSDQPPQISSLLLKGIIQDAGSRMALLTSGVSSYILRGGRLYDGRNHMMKGISGVIKTDSVVLMGSDRTIKELKVSTTL
jgi:hypothetical protein